MTKQTKRKGFTAIEMLVVIAIIAGLTAVVIPVVGNQTVKSKAAANASNLRTIESAISLKMAEDPDAFEAYFKNGGGHKDISESMLGKIYDSFFGEGEAGELADKYLLQYADTNTDGTTISINGTSPVVTISGVALARVMEAPRRDGSTGLVINPGADEYMSVYISEEGVLAFYGNYTKEDFADVAQDGYYDGTVSAGSGGNSGGIQGWIETGVCKLQGKHAPGPGCKCLTCGEVAHLDADKDIMQNYNSSTTLHECRCTEVFISGHIYEGSNHACKYKKNYKEACPEVSSCEDTDPKDTGIIFGDKADHYCYLCNAHMPDECVGHDNRPANHYCDVCGEWVKGSVCGVDNDTNYKCDVCGKVLDHTCVDIKNGRNDHKCNICNAEMGGTCGASLTYKDDGHYCSYCDAKKGSHDWKHNGATTQAASKHSCQTNGCTYQNIPCTFSNSRDDSCNVCESGCVTPDTLITLADGTQKRVDELTGTEQLLVWDHAAGRFSTAPVAYIIDHEKVVEETEIITLIFSDGNIVKIIGEHVFFDADEGKYVAITSANAERFIGHSFAAKAAYGNSLHMTELVDVVRTVEKTEIYEVVTYRNLTCFTNNVLSSCAFLDELLNIFEIDTETMAYDAEAMQADLEKYGTINYAFFAPFVSREIFDMYNGEYMSVAMGKGVLSLGDILDLIDLHYLYIGK